MMRFSSSIRDIRETKLVPIWVVSVFLLLVSGLFITSCNSGPKTREQYIEYVQEEGNGFVKTKELAGLKYTAFYKPPFYLGATDLDPKHPADAKPIDLASSFSGFITFSFRIGTNSGVHPLKEIKETEYNYFEKLEYYLTAENDFALIFDNGDTLRCAQYHFERNYGAAPFIDINLAFMRTDTALSNATLLFYDRVFSNGTIKFQYDEDKINEIPNFHI